MTIGKHIKYFFIILLLFSTTAYAAKGFQLNELFASIAIQSKAKVSFVQRRYFNFSTKPVISTGYLQYRAPDYLAQITLRPNRRTLIATQGWIIVKVNGRIQERAKLHQSPNVMVLTNTLKQVLGGNLARLKRNFKLSLQGDKLTWLLTLTPKGGITGNVSKIQLSGKGGKVLAISVRYSNGNLLALSLHGGK